jgi:hypothetical protein
MRLMTPSEETAALPSLTSPLTRNVALLPLPLVPKISTWPRTFLAGALTGPPLTTLFSVGAKMSAARRSGVAFSMKKDGAEMI